MNSGAVEENKPHLFCTFSHCLPVAPIRSELMRVRIWAALKGNEQDY